MIAYDLQCTKGHTFEGWFESIKTFEQQQRKGLVACSICDDNRVERLPSAFAIKSSQEPAAVPEVQTDTHGQKKELTKEIIDFVENNFDNVGADFAKEALKMHYGVTEPRNIRGVSSETEEETLKKEGIEFFKFPLPSSPDTDA